MVSDKVDVAPLYCPQVDFRLPGRLVTSFKRPQECTEPGTATKSIGTEWIFATVHITSVKTKLTGHHSFSHPGTTVC